MISPYLAGGSRAVQAVFQPTILRIMEMATRPEFLDLLSRYKNVRAVFNGHDHDEDNIKIKNKIPFIFDAHFGGNWGISYRGFRIVELRKDNSLLTYILNPSEKLNEQTL